MNVYCLSDADAPINWSHTDFSEHPKSSTWLSHLSDSAIFLLSHAEIQIVSYEESFVI
ncbi:MAG: hypothetical protein GYB31_15640 [Bacteroidetes bacterium]|nr:hypothetical protein [Bacteroidota bacterium]